MRIAFALVVVGCGSSPKSAPAVAPAPVAAEAPTQVAKGGDPEEGGEVASNAAPAAKPAAEPSVIGSQGDSAAIGGLAGAGDAAGGGGQGMGMGDIGTGAGTGGMRGRTSAAPHVKLGEVSVTGQLDKAIVRRYVKRNINRLQFCYERELAKNPGLAGHVVATFTIDPDGKVGAAHAKAFDANVGACIEHALGMIEFPKPKSGSVDVSYPLDFTQSQ
jgi:outer membrane biosynthesis protein TonB